jgi:hypothetical protein
MQRKKAKATTMRLEWHVHLEIEHDRCGASRAEAQGDAGRFGQLNLVARRRVGAHWPWLNAFLIGWQTFEERHAGKRGHARDARRRSRQHHESLGVPGKRHEGHRRAIATIRAAPPSVTSHAHSRTAAGLEREMMCASRRDVWPPPARPADAQPRC